MKTSGLHGTILGIAALGLGALPAFSADTDLDTMDDGFEDFFGLDKNNPADAALHQDGDLLLNFQEALLWTDPFAGDTDQDGWPDHADTNALSRAVMRWGAEQFTSGDAYDYTGPAWFLGAVKHNGNWLGHSWDVSATETNATSLNIFLDRQILTNSVRMVLTLMDRPGAGLEVDLLNTNGTAAATNVVGNLINGTGVEQWRKVSINLPSVPDGVFISLRRTTGHVTVFETQVYEDDDDDGLDKDQEAQLGTSDALADTDADGFNDWYESQAGTNPLAASSKPAGLLTLAPPPDTVLSCADSTAPAATGIATAAAQCDGPLAVTYSDNLLTDANSKQLHLKLDDEAGATTAADASLFNRVTTILGGAAMGAPGKSGTAALFDGVDDRISVPCDPALNAASVSFSLWARVDGGQGTYRSALTSRRDAGPNRGYILYAASNNNWEFWTAVGNGAWSVRGGGAVTLGAWTHIACSFDAATGKSAIWINGVLKSEAAAIYVPLSDYSYPLFVGAGGQAGTSFPFKGALDDVAVWNRALTPPDVAALFPEGLAGLPAKAASRIDRTWSVADRCGHTASRTQRIGIADTEAPVITAPADLDLPCDSGTGTNLAGVATATDACGTVARVDFADQPEDFAALLKATFALDEPAVSTNVVDVAGGITGRVFGAGTGDDGRIGRAVRFDGVNDYIDLATGPSVQGAGDFSVSAWIRTTDADGFAVSQRDGDADGYQGGYYLGVAGGLPMFKLYSWTYAETRTVTGTLAVNDGQWHHLLGVRKGSQAIQIYVDGQFAATAPSFGYGMNGNTSTTLGCNKRDNNNWFAGVVDDVAVYTSALSARAADALHRRGLDGRAAASLRAVTHRTWSSIDEHGNAATAVQTLVQGDDVGPLLTLPPNTSVFPGEDTSPAAVGVATSVDNCDPAPVIDWVDSDTFASSNLVSHWRFDEAAGAPNAMDESGVLAAAFAGGAAPGSAGVSGSAVYLDGVDDHLTLGTSATLSSCRSNLTVAAWIKPDRLTGVQRILSGAQAGWGFGLTDNALRFTTFGVKDYNTAVLPALQAGVWTHVAVALDSSATATFYVNGVAIQTIPGTAPANVNATAWRIGGNANGTERLAGRIDDLAIWNRAITSAEIARHFQLTRLGGTVLPAPVDPEMQMISRNWYAWDHAGNHGRSRNEENQFHEINGSRLSNWVQLVLVTAAVPPQTDMTEDKDGDGLIRAVEDRQGTNDSLTDSDGDGVLDWVEVNKSCSETSSKPASTSSDFSRVELAHMLGQGGIILDINYTFKKFGTVIDPQPPLRRSVGTSGITVGSIEAPCELGSSAPSQGLNANSRYISLESLGNGWIRLYLDHGDLSAVEEARYDVSLEATVNVGNGSIKGDSLSSTVVHDVPKLSAVMDGNILRISATLHYVESITDRTAGGFAYVDFKVNPKLPMLSLEPGETFSLASSLNTDVTPARVTENNEPVMVTATSDWPDHPQEIWWEITPSQEGGAHFENARCLIRGDTRTVRVLPGSVAATYSIRALPGGIGAVDIEDEGRMDLAGTASIVVVEPVLSDIRDVADPHDDIRVVPFSSECGTEATESLLTKGAISPAVRELKSLLNNLYPLREPLADSDVFDEKTKEAVIYFQADNGMRADGKVGDDAWTVLKSRDVRINNIAWIMAHSSATDSAPRMPNLELRLVGLPDDVAASAYLDVDYVRGNGTRATHHTEEDRIRIPAEENHYYAISGGLLQLYNNYPGGGFFGGEAKLVCRIVRGGEEVMAPQTIRFRVGGENPDPKCCREYIGSRPECGTTESLWYAYAIAKHETKNVNEGGSRYNQFLKAGRHRIHAGRPVFGDDRKADGSPNGGGGYGLFQLTSLPVTRSQIWNWRENVDEGISRLNRNMTIANNWMNDPRDVWNGRPDGVVDGQRLQSALLNGGNAVPVPDWNVQGVLFSDNTQTLTAHNVQVQVTRPIEHAVAIKLFNGGIYCSWDLSKQAWSLDDNEVGVSKEELNNYVSKVCAEVESGE